MEISHARTAPGPAPRTEPDPPLAMAARRDAPCGAVGERLTAFQTLPAVSAGEPSVGAALPVSRSQAAAVTQAAVAAAGNECSAGDGAQGDRELGNGGSGTDLDRRVPYGAETQGSATRGGGPFGSDGQDSPSGRVLKPWGLAMLPADRTDERSGGASPSAPAVREGAGG